MKKAFFISISFLLSMCAFGMESADASKNEEPVQEQQTGQLVQLQKAVFYRDIKGVIANLLSHEKTSIKGAYYAFELPELANAWAKQKRDYTISGGLIVHGKKVTPAISHLLLHGVPVRYAHVRPGFMYGNMHHKFLCLSNTVGGKQLVVTGSFNATAAADIKNYEDIIIIEDEAVFKKYEQEYDLLVASHSSPIRGQDKPIQPAQNDLDEYPDDSEPAIPNHTVFSLPYAVFSPGIKEVLKALIGHEQRSFYGASFRFNLYDVAEAWVQKHQELVAKPGAVKNPSALLVDRSFNNETPQALQLLVDANIPVKELKAPIGVMHHKFFVFSKNKQDNPVLVTGSFNPTGQADQANWENLVVTDDNEAFVAYKKHFMKLLAASVALPENALSYTKKVSSKVAEMNAIPKDKRH